MDDEKVHEGKFHMYIVPKRFDMNAVADFQVQGETCSIVASIIFSVIFAVEAMGMGMDDEKAHKGKVHIHIVPKWHDMKAVANLQVQGGTCSIITPVIVAFATVVEPTV